MAPSNRTKAIIPLFVLMWPGTESNPSHFARPQLITASFNVSKSAMISANNSFENEYGIELHEGIDRKGIVDLITSKTKEILTKLDKATTENQL